ncbi:hypothetical protein QBC39DRAFT_51685 [Podospora conica]|nr:hypothetical protein QBC39DRAFT_51685 [Schizothecium conicum]
MAALVPRQLNGGSIAGAVVGSVVGALLLLFCIVLPVLRARRRRRTARDGDADLQAEMGQSPSTGGRSSPTQVDESKKISVDPLDPAHGPTFSLDKPPHPTGPYPTSDSDITGNRHPKAASDHPHPAQPSSPSVAVQHGLPSPISSPPPATLPSDQPTGQAYPASPADHPTPPPTRLPPSGPVSKQGTRDLSVTDSLGHPSRELTEITTGGITQEPESFDNSSQPAPQRRFSHISGSIRSLLHRRRDSQQRRDSKRSTLGGTDGARSPSVSTTGAFGQQDLSQTVFDIDINAQGEAWSYYHDPNLIPPPSAPAGTSLFPPVHEAGQPPLSPISLPDQQQFIPGPGVPPFLIGPNVVEEPYDIFADGTTPAAPLRPYGGRSSLLRGPGGTLTRTDSLPPLQPIVSDIDGPNLNYSFLPSGNPMYIMGPPTNEAESAHHLQHEMLRINSPPQPTELPLEYPEQTQFPDQTQYSTQTQYPQQAQYSQQAEYPQQSEEVREFIRNNMNGVDLNQPFKNDMGDMSGVNLNGPFIKNDMNGVDLNQVGYGYHSPPDIAVNGQDFGDLGFNSGLMGDHQLDPQAVTGYPSYFTPPPSSGPSIQNTPETRLSEYTASPSPRSDIDTRPGLAVESSPRFFPCDQCDRVFDQVHKLNHHKRYHDRPHECVHPGCTMRFGTKTHLDRHINDKHNKTRKFYCTQHECPYSKQGGKSFPRKDNWRRHMVNKHRIAPDTDPVEYNDEIMT